MDIAKVTSKGQITIPIDIRNALGVKAGDKVVFFRDGDRIVMMNASLEALYEAQKAFSGVAERHDISSEQDVVDLIKSVREKNRGNYRCE